MVHSYQITGMTCSNCEAKVKASLLTVAHVISVEVSKEKKSVTVTMDQHVGLEALQKALSDRYQLSVIAHH